MTCCYRQRGFDYNSHSSQFSNFGCFGMAVPKGLLPECYNVFEPIFGPWNLDEFWMILTGFFQLEMRLNVVSISGQTSWSTSGKSSQSISGFRFWPVSRWLEVLETSFAVTLGANNFWFLGGNFCLEIKMIDCVIRLKFTIHFWTNKLIFKQKVCLPNLKG